MRDFRILVREFWVSISVFAAVLLLGGYLLSHLYHVSGKHLGYDKAVYYTFTMVFFQSNLELPDEWYLQIFFYVVPLLGLGVIVEGFTRFGMLVVNKKLRGEVWQRIVASTYSDHIILCGMGHIGYRVAEQLIMLGKEFVVLAYDSQFVSTIKEHGIPVLLGDARDELLLTEARVEKARTIIVATDNDLANLDIVITARERNPNIRTIVRLFDADLGRKIQKSLGIDMAFSTSTLTAPAVALAALSKSILHSFYVGQELMSLAELAVGEDCAFIGKTIEQLESSAQLTVVVHRTSSGVRYHPQPQDMLAKDDMLLFMADLKTVEALQQQGFYLAAETRQLGDTSLFR